jgi:hypothetical protein
MRMSEEMERQYVADSLVAAGVLVSTWEEKIPVLPLFESPAKIPVSETFDLKTPSTPPVIELPKVDPENDLSITAGASCDQTCSCRSESKAESQQPPKYEVADIFNLYGEEYRQNHKLTTDQLNSMSCMLLSIAAPQNMVSMLMYATTAVILKQPIIPAATAIVPNVKALPNASGLTYV